MRLPNVYLSLLDRGGSGESSSGTGGTSLTLTSVSPDNAVIGEVVTIEGTNFIGITSVVFNGVDADSYDVVSTSEITAVVPDGGGPGLLVVTGDAGSASISFNGGGLSASVLDFPGSSGVTVMTMGKFYTTGVDLPVFLAEVIAMPRECGSRYVATACESGSHPFAIGWTQNDVGFINLPTWNIFNGTVSMSGFGGDDGCYPGYWHHWASGWDGSYCYSYMDGIVVGKVPFAGPRQCVGVSGGFTGGDLYVGGPLDHSLFDGRFKSLRLWEGDVPLTYYSKAYTPEWDFAGVVDWLATDPDTGYMRPVCLIDVSAGGRVFPDCGTGFDGVGTTGTLVRHPGTIPVLSGFPRPSLVVDTNAPDGLATSTTRPQYIFASIPVPVYASRFDSFGGLESTPFWDQASVSMGTSQGGSSGTAAWLTSCFSGFGPTVTKWGKINGRACFCDSYMGIATLDQGTSDMRVEISRRVGNFNTNISDLQTGLCLRADALQPSLDAIFVSVMGAADSSVAVIGAWIAGSPTVVQNGASDYASVTLPANTAWEVLAADIKGTSLKIYTGVNSGMVDANGSPIYTYTLAGTVTCNNPSLPSGKTRGGLSHVPVVAGFQTNNAITSLARYGRFVMSPTQQ